MYLSSFAELLTKDLLLKEDLHHLPGVTEASEGLRPTSSVTLVLFNAIKTS